MPTASSRNIAASNVTDGRTPSAPLPRHLRPDPASTYRSAACRQATDCFAPATARPIAGLARLRRTARSLPAACQIVRATGRERVWTFVLISVDAQLITKKTDANYYMFMRARTTQHEHSVTQKTQ